MQHRGRRCRRRPPPANPRPGATRRRWGRKTGRRPRTSFGKAAVNNCRGPPGPSARGRATLPPPSPRLPSGPRREGRTVTDPGRPPAPSRRPHFGSACLATRNPRQPSPANLGSNALQKERAPVCPDLTSLARYPLAPTSQNCPPPGSKGFPKTNLTWLTQ